MDLFGERFKGLRKEKGLTQEELVEKFNKLNDTHFNKSTISQYENNKRKPELPILYKWANFYGVSLDFILGRSEIKSLELEDDMKAIKIAYEKMSLKDRAKMMFLLKEIFDINLK